MRTLVALTAWIALLIMAAGSVLGGDAVILLRDPRAVDGDTLAVDRPGTGVVLYVRLWGIAAPERGEPLGDTATAALAHLVEGKTLRCAPRARPSHGRVVAQCEILDQKRDIAALMVSSGLARDCPRYSSGAYRRSETDAARRLPLPGYCEVSP